MEEHYKIGKAAKYLGYTTRSLQLWDRDGKLTAIRSATGHRYYTKDQLDQFLCKKKDMQPPRDVIAYCRVSSNNQRPDLKNQRSVIEDFCISRGLANVHYIEEIGGGLNFKRKKFLEIITMILTNKVSVLVLAHKDRFTRFGFDLIEYLCKQYDVEILILNSEKLSPEKEMVQDLMTIIHCFSSRLYGLRNYKKSLKESLRR